MVLGGLQKLTLLDFPNHVACTVFTKGCNFRCPFCHNALLVEGQEVPDLDVEEFFSFLQKRKGLLDGVAVTGGEPLLQADIIPFLRRIKDMGYAVKLDTNGSFPATLRDILNQGLADYVAMDVKNTREKYPLTAGWQGDVSQVEESIRILLDGTVPYEFRTTAVHELHTAEDFASIGRWIQGAQRYYIQQFRESEHLLGEGFTAPTEEQMNLYLQAAREYIPHAQLRGL
jgi:pyruvate formate lyase activating enzyme